MNIFEYDSFRKYVELVYIRLNPKNENQSCIHQTETVSQASKLDSVPTRLSAPYNLTPSSSHSIQHNSNRSGSVINDKINPKYFCCCCICKQTKYSYNV